MMAIDWQSIAEWLRTPMDVSYAQVIGAGCVVIVLLWMLGTLALWWQDEALSVHKQRVINRQQARAIGDLNALVFELENQVPRAQRRK